MGAHSRSKGKRAEREIVTLARAAGLTAVRTWHTAQGPDPLIRRCDVMMCGRSAQVRVRADGFKAVYDALEGVEIAFIKSDRQPWLAVLPAERLLALLAKSGEGEGPRIVVDQGDGTDHDAGITVAHQASRISGEVLI